MKWHVSLGEVDMSDRGPVISRLAFALRLVPVRKDCRRRVKIKRASTTHFKFSVAGALVSGEVTLVRYVDGVDEQFRSPCVVAHCHVGNG